MGEVVSAHLTGPPKRYMLTLYLVALVYITANDVITSAAR